MNVTLLNTLLTLSYPLILLLLSANLSANNIPSVAVVAAASNIQFALEEINQAFFQDTGRLVQISYGSSGHLTHQILQGAPFQLFLSANQTYIKHLSKQHKTQGKEQIYAIGRLALVVHQASGFTLDSHLNGIKQAIKQGQLQHFSIANPNHAPYGMAARDVIQTLGDESILSPYLVIGENVAQANQFIQSGAAQAGLVAYSLTQVQHSSVFTRSLLIPASMHRPLLQSMILLKTAGETARLFFHYLQQPQARTILVRYGYQIP